MALPTKNDLLELDVSWRGAPFVRVEAKSLDTKELDWSWRGAPFVVAASGSATQALTQDTRFDNTNTFYAPTVTTLNSLEPFLFTNQNQFFPATITGGEQPVTGGGIGHGGFSRKKKRQIYIEREGKVYLFDNAYQAAQWVEYQKNQELDGKIVKLKKKKKPKVEPKVIDVDEVEYLASKYDYIPEFKQISIDIDYYAMYDLMQKLIEMREEEDIEMLLLAA